MKEEADLKNTLEKLSGILSEKYGTSYSIDYLIQTVIDLFDYLEDEDYNVEHMALEYTIKTLKENIGLTVH